MKDFWDKVKNLKSWGYVAIFGYIQFLSMTYLMNSGTEPSGSLAIAFYMLWVYIASLIISFALFTFELLDKKIINNKVAIIIGCVLYLSFLFIVLYCCIKNEIIQGL